MRSIEFQTNLNDKESYEIKKVLCHRNIVNTESYRVEWPVGYSIYLFFFFMESGSLPSGHASQRANTMRKENCLSPQLSAANLFAYGQISLLC